MISLKGFSLITHRSLAEELREGTADLHAAAENTAFAGRLIRGEVGRDSLVVLMQQAQHLHRIAEAAASDLLPSPGLSTIHDLRRSEKIDSALVGLGEAKDATAYPATQALADQLRADTAHAPAAVAGFIYVTEGANHGNRLVARRLNHTLGDLSQLFAGYLDPHGSRQAEQWKGVKQWLNGLEAPTDQRDLVLAQARATFSFFIALYEYLDQP